MFKSPGDINNSIKMKKMANRNKYLMLNHKLYTINNAIQQLKIIKIRIKTKETAKLLRSNAMSIRDFKIFKNVDKVYHKFVGAYKNIPVSLILYKEGYDFNTMQKLFDFIKLLKIKNSKARQASMKFKVENAIA